ncbi:hypothetical protein N7510_001206 [Penicillium lagena]|uniref:uncharacterized protein n=1 Tax=Penicillium lagena TaxID=94218 RepID=UPI0025413EA7|nr:uncharacterized protein N7510_001206 [Penicillium lagena]KAJ5624897.1 hypothetical protein N7510_001206 [Penicillium lagena]
MNEWNLYGYTPSIPAAVIFIILFACSTTYHGIQLTKARCWYFIPFVVGGVFQIIGYVCRAVGHNDLASVPLYAMQSLFILLAPPMYAASVYMVLGRLTTYLHAEERSLVNVRWMTKIFVSGDVLSFLTQGSGGGLMAGSGNSRKIGSYVVVGGLVIQLVFFGFFVITAAVFHVRINRNPTSKAQAERDITRAQGWRQRNWATVLLALYLVSALILVRSIFRLVEYLYGFNGFPMTHEAFMYGFDALLMFSAMVIMNVYHPATILGDGKGGREIYADAVEL